MKLIASKRLALLASAALLALPIAAYAQSMQAPAAQTPAAGAPEAAAPQSTDKSAEERVGKRIAELRAQLHITPAEQPQWDQFAQTMRDNARQMDQTFMQRAQQYQTMTALQNMQSYEQIAEMHAQQLQKLVPAFEGLYNAMPEQQKKIADEVFLVKAENHAQKRMQTGRRE